MSKNLFSDQHMSPSEEHLYLSSTEGVPLTKVDARDFVMSLSMSRSVSLLLQYTFCVELPLLFVHGGGVDMEGING